jgi:hypothetical protein
MITLSVSNGTATPLSIADTGTTGYVLTRDGWNNGGVENRNTYAESRWVDGASLTSSKQAVVSMNLAVRAWGTSISDLSVKVDAIGAALSQFSYTITESFAGGGSAVHTCMPASDINMSYDPDLLQHNVAIVTAVIPRQP